MKDNEIIKSLEICGNDGDCKNCSINPHKGNYGYCTSLAIKAALDLINRQNSNIEELKIKNSNLISDLSSSKEEIEKLTKVNATLLRNADTAYQEGLNEARALYACEVRNIIRAEAVKEFAEMVKETAVTNITIGGSTYYCVGLHHLDNLVKEFPEGDDTE